MKEWGKDLNAWMNSIYERAKKKIILKCAKPQNHCQTVMKKMT